MRAAALVLATVGAGCGPAAVDRCLEQQCAALGEACQRDADCTSLCGSLGAAAVCMQSCDNGCAGDETCTLALTGGGTALAAACVSDNALGGLLGADCATDSDCASQWCEAGACAQPCGDCGPAARCEPRDVQRFGQSARVPVCVPDLAPVLLSLGPIAVTAAGSVDVLLDVPAGLASFTIVLRHDATDYAERVGFWSLSAPDGTVLLDITDSQNDLNPAPSPFPGVASLLVPDTADASAAPQAGLYTLRVGLFTTTDFVTYTPVAGNVDEVLLVGEPLAEEGGAFDLNLFFSPGTGVSAATAATDPRVTDMLARLDGFYRGLAGVGLGAVEFSDTAASHDVVEDFDEVRDMLRLESWPGRRGISVNAFVVQDVAGTSGVSGGVPGPPGLFNTPASGAVIEVLADGSQTGALLAHEIGHLFGLFHSTDSGTKHDPLSDTPECASGTPIVDCPDYANLMFPYFPAAAALSLSAQQVAVLRRNSMLYEQPRSGCAGRDAYDLSSRFASSTLAGAANVASGSCGGGATVERVQLYRLRSAQLSALEFRVTANGFAPVVYARLAACDDALAEVVCSAGVAGVESTARIVAPQPGSYFVMVEGDPDAGPFTLEAVEVP